MEIAKYPEPVVGPLRRDGQLLHRSPGLEWQTDGEPPPPHAELAEAHLHPTSDGLGTHVRVERVMHVPAQVGRRAAAPVLEDVQVGLPFVLRDAERGRVLPVGC